MRKLKKTLDILVNPTTYWVAPIRKQVASIGPRANPAFWDRLKWEVTVEMNVQNMVVGANRFYISLPKDNYVFKKMDGNRVIDA